MGSTGLNDGKQRPAAPPALPRAGKPEKALVLFSGGQDSAICLAHALSSYSHVETIGFEYGQRHRVEIDAREKLRAAYKAISKGWAARLGPDHQFDLNALDAMGSTAMTSALEIKINETGLPTTFVPGRNLVFLTLAAALAYRRGQTVLVGGMCETDFSGYPDCRREALDAQMRAINLGMEAAFTLDTPLMALDKAQSWALAHELGGARLVDIVLEESHTCYLGDRSQRFDWGYGCGGCPACDLRAAGWMAYSSASSARTNGEGG